MIDYLLTDYFIELLTIKNTWFNALINKLPENREYYSLITKLNDEYNNTIYSGIMKASPIQKLTYKGTLKQFNRAGKLTNYGYLISKGLD